MTQSFNDMRSEIKKIQSQAQLKHTQLVVLSFFQKKKK